MLELVHHGDGQRHDEQQRNEEERDGNDETNRLQNVPALVPTREFLGVVRPAATRRLARAQLRLAQRLQATLLALQLIALLAILGSPGTTRKIVLRLQILQILLVATKTQLQILC